MAVGVGDMDEKIQFEPPLPHFHPGAFQRSGSKQRRGRVEMLEIAADGDGFSDDLAVIEHQRRGPAQRVHGRIGGRAMLLRADINRNRRHAQALFAEENAHAARVRGIG